MNEFARLVESYRGFANGGLTENLANLERDLEGALLEGLGSVLKGIGATDEALRAALELKSIVGQIHVAIHALGILLCLPLLLEPDEAVESLSLGAGNTGKDFDLETDRRVAEFKFIAWRGGSETIRQNSVFKDFFLLAEHPTPKRKYLYVVDVEEPLRFFNGGRKVSSVLKDAPLSRRFRELHGDRYRVVRDYFQPRQGVVRIEDVAGLLPHIFLKTLDITDPDVVESDEGASRASVTKPSVLASPLVALFRRFHGTEHLTNPKRVRYSVDVTEKALIFTPATTRKRRREPWLRVNRVLSRFEETRSARPKNYLDLTRNSSYLLPLLVILDQADAGE